MNMGPMRRTRRRNSFRQKSNVNFTGIIGIMCIAVLLGYGTTKFVIYPIFHADNTQVSTNSAQVATKTESVVEKLLNFFMEKDNTQENQGSGENTQQNGGNTQGGTIVDQGTEQNQQGNATIVEDQLNVTKTDATANAVTTTQSGYCIQFGSFSTKNSAETLVTQLKGSGINAEIIEKDGAFKVVSQLFEQKEQAVATMNSLTGEQFADAFVTPR